MLSRVADSLYWMSRYLERAEHTVRLLDTNLSLMLDEGEDGAERRWRRVLLALGNPAELEWKGDAYQLARTITFDANEDASITACIVAARENARQVREQISTEQWQRLNRMFHAVTRPEGSEVAEILLSDFLQSVMEGVHLFQGVTDSTMSHGEGWQFIQVGRYIERAAETASLLSAYPADFWSWHERTPEGSEYLEWIGLLRSCTAFEAYCKMYTADVYPDRILQFLLLNEEFPHSVRYSIDHLERALEAIHGEGGKRRAAPLMRTAGRLQSLLNFADISEILAGDIGEYLKDIRWQCQEIHEMIYQIDINYSIQAALAG